MKRYSSTKRKRDKSNITSYTTTMYPSIPIENSDKFIVTKIGDRLDTLAHRYYGDITLWWVIAKANHLSDGKIGVDPEKKMRIPQEIEKILESL